MAAPSYGGPSPNDTDTVTLTDNVWAERVGVEEWFMELGFNLVQRLVHASIKISHAAALATVTHHLRLSMILYDTFDIILYSALVHLQN